jgi:hypothetical protein
MIYQRDDMPVLEERPARHIPRAMWAFRRLISVVDSPFREQRENIGKLRLSRLLSMVGRFEYRSQLESLLGAPRYTLAGSLYGGMGHVDAVEVYERLGCCVELGFENRRFKWTLGYVQASSWDIVHDLGRRQGEFGEDVLSPKWQA